MEGERQIESETQRREGRQCSKRERHRGKRDTGIVRHRCESEMTLESDANSQGVGGGSEEVKQVMARDR